MMVYTLGEKIKLKRKEKNMTLKDLAGDRITPGQISLVESGKSNPSIDLLEYLSERLNADVEYFLESEEKQANRICEFYVNIAEASSVSGDFSMAWDAIEKGSYYAEKYSISHFKGLLDMIKANVKYLNGELEEAEQYCLSANSIFLRNDNIEETVKSIILLGLIALKMGYTNTALNYFMQSNHILKENNYLGEFLKSQIYYNISLCFCKMGDMNSSIDYALLSKERLLGLNNKKDYADKLLKLSVTLTQEGKLDDGLYYAKEAKKIYSELKDLHEMANMETNLGVIFSKGSQNEEAIIHFENAIKLKKQINDMTLADSFLKLCDHHIETKEFDKAEQILDTVKSIIKEDDHLYKIKCSEYLFNIYNRKGNKKEAEKILLQGVEYLEGLGYKKQLGDFYSILGKFYIEINEKELALKYISKGLDIYKELGVILND